MEIESKRVFTVEDTTVKLQVITALESAESEKEHFFVLLQDLTCHVSVAFKTEADAIVCFNSFLKMKTF